MATTRRPVTGRTRDLVIWADRRIFQLAKHWLAAANLFWVLYVGLPVMAPLFMEMGWTLPARAIYLMYSPLCHQRPERSYFLGGPKMVYSAEELEAAGVHTGLFSRDIGNEAVGWKVAFCERDLAIYTSILGAGLVYGLVRRRLGNWQMPWRHALIFLVPLGIDGLLQFFGVYESTWVLRTVTGAIFGVGGVFFAYPYLEEGFADIRRTVNEKLHLE